MVTKNSTTINLTGEEQTVQFDRSYPYFWVQNLGDKDVFISMDSGIVEGADGVITVPAGGSCGTMHGYPADRLYLLGSGKVQIMGTGSAFNPFKTSWKGGVDGTLSKAGYAADSKVVGDKLKVLQDVINGVTHRFVTDNTTAYSKSVPVGAKIASVNRVGGKTVCFNQLQVMPTIDNTINISQNSNVVIDSVINGKITITDNDDNNGGWGIVGININTKGVVGHKYYCRATFTIEQAGGQSLWYVFGDTASATNNIVKSNVNITDPQTVSVIGVCNKSNYIYGFLQFKMGGGITFSAENMMCFDLTKMFGAGNEPSTVEEFEAMFPDDYYPYNEGTLMPSPITAFNSIIDGRILQTKEMPSAVLALEGYGDGINDSVYNYIDFETMTYQKCVGRDEETLSVYVLDKPVVTDITDMLPADFNILDVMTDGKIVFENTNKIAVPNEVEYIVDLAEVIAND